MKKYTITKTLTHNIVFATHETTDYILMGKGIGFQKKLGDLVSEDHVTNDYIVHDVKKVSQYESIVLNTSDLVIQAVEAAIHQAEDRLDHSFSETLHISLLDHINFSIYRLKHGLTIDSFFSEEFYVFYPELYDTAKEMFDLINDSLQIHLPESEIGAIVMHLQAGLNGQDISQTYCYSEIIDYTVSYLADHLPNTKQHKTNLARLITHLKFALKRQELGESLDNDLTDVIKNSYRDSYQLAQELFDQIDARYDVHFSQEEIAYMVLHIERLK